MTGNQRRRRAHVGKTTGCIAVNRQALVGSHAVDQRLAHEVMTEAVATVGDDQHPGVERMIEHRERRRLDVTAQ